MVPQCFRLLAAALFLAPLPGAWAAHPRPLPPQGGERAVAPGPGAPESEPGAGSWAQYRGGPAATGVSASRRPSYGTLTLKWKYWTGSNQSSTPAVARGLVVVGTEDGDLHAIHAETGKKAWTTLVGPRIAGQGIVVCSPLILDGIVYIGNKAGILSAVRLDTGDIVWQHRCEGKQPEIYSSPRGDRRGIVFGVVDGNSGRVVCLDPEGGAVKWSTPARREIGASPAFLGDSVYIPAKDRILYELDYGSGRVLREIALTGTTHSTPVLDLGMAYVIVGSGDLMGIDLLTGRAAFEVTSGSDEKTTLASSGRRLYVPAGRDLVARNPLTGAIEWKYTAAHKVSPPVVNGRDILFTSQAGFLHVVNENGEDVFKIDLGEPLFSGPVVVDGVVYCAAAGMRSGFHVYALQ